MQIQFKFDTFESVSGNNNLSPHVAGFLKGGISLTIKEMQEDILRRFYESSVKLLENKKLSEAERNQILHETANVFGFACEKIKMD